MLLARAPRGLEWEELDGVASRERLLGFDFSPSSEGSPGTASAPENEFVLELVHGTLVLELGSACARIPTGRLPMLSIHLILKMILNAHSTLVMGRLGRFDGNLMSWVKPSNHKLVDRAIRYADILLKEKGMTRTYEELAEALFDLNGKIPADRSLVLAMADRLSVTP